MTSESKNYCIFRIELFGKIKQTTLEEGPDRRNDKTHRTSHIELCFPFYLQSRRIRCCPGTSFSDNQRMRALPSNVPLGNGARSDKLHFSRGSFCGDRANHPHGASSCKWANYRSKMNASSHAHVNEMGMPHSLSLQRRATKSRIENSGIVMTCVGVYPKR